ncbi:MAG: DUF3105 domain-containing protein [Nocardioidaceae bacterium]
MAKPNKDRDRRAVVEQLRKDQKRAERRRTIIVISACVAVAILIIGAAAVPLIKQSRLNSKPLASLGAGEKAAGCQPILKKQATGNQEHKPEGTPITYADAPPAFGPHYPVTAPFERKFYTSKDRPQIEYVVHNLEHGYSMLWYDATIAKDPAKLDVVKAIAKKYEGTKLTDKFIALPWTSQDGKSFPSGTHIALTHWSAGGDPTVVSKQKGVWQYCASPSGSVTEKFTKDYPYSDSPEPQAL